MKVVHGRVEHGCVVVDEPLAEGTEVTVVVATSDESFDLDEEQIAALRQSIDEANRGELVPLDEVLSGR
jgi:predicted transcriptional regulator